MLVPIHCSNSWYVIARKGNAKQMFASVKFNLKCTNLCGCKDCNNREEKPIESHHEGSDESENKESDVPDNESVLLTDSDYDDDF